MTPDEIIRAFLRVLADKLFNFPPKAVDDLSALSQKLTALQDQPVSAAAPVIKEWCKQHPEVRDAVLVMVKREVTEVGSATPAGEETILRNRYPELPQAIKDRNNASQQSPQQSKP